MDDTLTQHVLRNTYYGNATLHRAYGETAKSPTNASAEEATMDIQTILRWIIIGVVILIGLGLLGLLIDIGTALISLALRVLVIVLVVAIIIRVVDGMRSSRA